MQWVIFGIVWLTTIWYYQTRPVPKPVIIGIPDADNKRVIWLAKGEKTKWDEIKEKMPAFIWGAVAGGVIILVVMA